MSETFELGELRVLAGKYKPAAWALRQISELTAERDGYKAHNDVLAEECAVRLDDCFRLSDEKKALEAALEAGNRQLVESREVIRQNAVDFAIANGAIANLQHELGESRKKMEAAPHNDRCASCMDEPCDCWKATT